MNLRVLTLLLLGCGGVAVWFCGQTTSAGGQTAAPAARALAATDDEDRPADRDALRIAAREFAEAFNRGEAKTIAAEWTEKGEFYSDSGAVLRGRPAIEKAYAEHFKEKPGGKIEVDIRSIYFPSRDSAVEDGVLRLRTVGGEMPTSTAYSIIHVREDGKWKVALAREWGAAAEKLDDLAWLIGDWVVNGKDREVLLSFEWNDKKNTIKNRFSMKEGGKTVSSGTQTISVDPMSGELRSWVFEEDGGRGEARWFRDGDRWVQESVGALPDGTPTEAYNVITRIDHDHFVFRSVDRLIGGEPAPDTTPVKVSRVQTAPVPTQK